MSLLIKNKSAINIINKMIPEINPCGDPKSAFNFAISKPWGMQSKALERLVRTTAKTLLRPSLKDSAVH